MQRSSSRFRSIFLALAAVSLPLSLAGCHKAIRDQAQVDPVVASHVQFSGAGFGQPLPLIPNCSVQQWIDRAAGHQTDHKCPLSRSPGQTVELNKYPGSEPNEKVRRTQVQAELMTYADQVCDGHVAGIYSKHATANLNFGFLSLLFSGGAAVAAGRTATNLAAGSALFSGTRSLVNSEVYYSYIGPAVMREIRAMRSDLRKQITEKRSCDVNDYPPQEAINDALIYHDACSFSAGLASLLSKAGDTKVGEDKLRVAQLKAMAARLSAKQAELDAAEKELDAVIPVDAASTKAERLRSSIASLRQEIARLDAVLAFSGVVDPEGAAPVATDPKMAVIAEQAALISKQRDLATANESERSARSAEVDLAQKRYDFAVARNREANKLDTAIAESQRRIAELSKRRDMLTDAKQKLPGTAVQRRAEKDTEIAQVVSEINVEEQKVEDAKLQKKAASIPESSQGQIEFGIQRCAPVTPPTVR